MKKLLAIKHLMFLLLVLCFSVPMLGQEVVYTLDATNAKNQGTNNSYTSNGDVTVGDITWNATGNITMSPWRIGGKSISGVDREVYSKTAFPQALSKVSLEIGNASSITINSIKLQYSTNADFSGSTTITASGNTANTTYDFTPSGGFPANAYYKFVFNVSVSGSSNKFVEFKTVKFYSNGGVTPPTPTTYSVTVANNITGGTVTASPTSAKEGDEVTLTATPASGYEFGTWNVTNESTSATITVTNNKFKMPAANVNVSATFNEAQPEPEGLKTSTIDLTTKQTTSESEEELKWTGSYGFVTSTKLGSTSTNANNYCPPTNNTTRFYKGNELKFTPASGVVITSIVYEAATAAYAANMGANEWVNATVSVNNTTVTITPKDGSKAVYTTISTTTGGKSFTIKYTGGDTPTPEKELIAIGVTGTPAEFWKGDAFNHNGITVTALWDDEDETDVTADCEFSGYDMSTAGEQTVTVTYQGETATYTINVKTIANTQETAYTVAEAKALIDAGKDLETEVYVKGTVSKVDSYNDTYKSITYWIDNNEFEVYSGKGLNGADFASVNDITVGDDVVVKGIIKKYQSTYEFDKNNVLVKHVKVATLSIADITVANGEDITPVVNTNVTGDYLIEYVSNNEEVVLAADNELVTMGVGEATITATLVADGYKDAETTFKVTVTSNVSVTSVTLGGTPKLEYTYGEAFDRTGITATANYSDDSQVDVTSTATWTVAPSTALTESGEVTVTAAFGGQTASQTYNVTVNKKTASVAIENVEVEVGKTATISATTTPADAALTYTVTEGADKISIADGVITGVAEGTATVKAAFAGNDEYNTAETTFTVTVTPHCDVTTLSKDGDIKFVTGTSSAANAFWANSTPLTANGLTLSGSNNSASNYSYFDGSVVRFYQNNSFTITPDDGVTITKIEIVRQTSTSSNSGVINCDVLTASDNNTTTNTNVYTGPTTSAVTFTAAAQARFTAVKVYTEPTAPVGTLDHIAVVEGYKADYTDGDAFEKATVMAYYVEEGVDPVDVTNKATFSGYDLSAETSGEQTVNVSYTEGEVTATTSYPINFTAVTKRTVTIVEPVNGQLKVVVKATGAEIATGARVADGTVLKITNAPDEGYVLRKIVVTDTEKHNYTAQDKEITVNGIDVTINAIFIKGDNYTYTWSVNGQVASQDVYEAGATVTAPAVTAGQCPAGKTFVGWSRTATVDADNCTLATVDPTAVTDRTYFAVFAKAEITGGSGETYYEKVPSNWTDWTNGEYLIVYEKDATTGYVFDGQASGVANYVTASIKKNDDGVNIIEDKNGGAYIKIEPYNTSSKVMRINGTQSFIYASGSDTGKFSISDGAVSVSDISYGNTDISYDNQWVVKIYRTYLRFSTNSNDFRVNNTATGFSEVCFYVKKNAGTTTYSEYTTGMTVNPRDFQLVTDLEKDLKPGREYIIVSKFINDDNSRTIYGLSVDNADSRTENGKEGENKTTTNFRRGETGVTFSHGDYFASIDNKISVLTLEDAEGAWAFNSAAGYLVKGGNATETFLRINSNSAKATISKDNLDVATIIYKVVKDGEEVDGNREVFLNINGGYPRYGAYAHSNLTEKDKKFNFAASYLYYREFLNEETLAEIEANGLDGTEYTVIDDLVVAYVDPVKRVAWAHDMAKSYAYRENTYDATWYGGYDADSYTQHNWVMLTFPEGTDMNNKVVNQQLSNVNGTYHGHKGVSHVIDVSSFGNAAIERGNSVSANTYNMASFWDDNTYDYVTVLGKNFFFMNPKIEEVCYITEAVWNGTGFVVPANQTVMSGGEEVHLNSGDLKGGVKVNWAYNDGGAPAEIGEDRYTFLAVVTKNASAHAAGGAGAPAKVAPSDCGLTDYVVYPLDFTVTNNIVTEVKDVDVAGREVKSVRFYDIAGRARSEAQPGINIVVTEYTDGTHSTAKMVR